MYRLKREEDDSKTTKVGDFMGGHWRTTKWKLGRGYSADGDRNVCQWKDNRGQRFSRGFQGEGRKDTCGFWRGNKSTCLTSWHCVLKKEKEQKQRDICPTEAYLDIGAWIGNSLWPAFALRFLKESPKYLEWFTFPYHIVIQNSLLKFLHVKYPLEVPYINQTRTTENESYFRWKAVNFNELSPRFSFPLFHFELVKRKISNWIVYPDQSQTKFNSGTWPLFDPFHF